MKYNFVKSYRVFDAAIRTGGWLTFDFFVKASLLVFDLADFEVFESAALDFVVLRSAVFALRVWDFLPLGFAVLDSVPLNFVDLDFDILDSVSLGFDVLDCVPVALILSVPGSFFDFAVFGLTGFDLAVTDFCSLV